MFVLNKRKLFTHKENRKKLIGNKRNQRRYSICCKQKKFVYQQTCVNLVKNISENTKWCHTLRLGPILKFLFRIIFTLFVHFFRPAYTCILANYIHVKFLTLNEANGVLNSNHDSPRIFPWFMNLTSPYVWRTHRSNMVGYPGFCPVNRYEVW